MNHKVSLIETNFKIPESHRDRYILYGSEGRLEIKRASDFTVSFESRGGFSGIEDSMSLDWIQEVIETIRFHSENP